MDHPLVRAQSVTLADIPIPEPGKIVEIPLTEELRKRGFVYAAVHGLGQFWFADGQCVASAPMERYMPDPQVPYERWKCSSVFGPSLLLVAAPGSAAAKAIAWAIDDQDGRRIDDGYYDRGHFRWDAGDYVIWKEQFKPLPDSRTFKVVIGDPERNIPPSSSLLHRVRRDESYRVVQFGVDAGFRRVREPSFAGVAAQRRSSTLPDHGGCAEISSRPPRSI